MNSIFVSESKCFNRLDSLIASAVTHLENIGYRNGTIKNYQYTWKEFAQFTLEKTNEKRKDKDKKLLFQSG